MNFYTNQGKIAEVFNSIKLIVFLENKNYTITQVGITLQKILTKVIIYFISNLNLSAVWWGNKSCLTLSSSQSL